MDFVLRVMPGAGGFVVPDDVKTSILEFTTRVDGVERSEACVIVSFDSFEDIYKIIGDQEDICLVFKNDFGYEDYRLIELHATYYVLPEAHNAFVALREKNQRTKHA